MDLKMKELIPENRETHKIKLEPREEDIIPENPKIGYSAEENSVKRDGVYRGTRQSNRSQMTSSTANANAIPLVNGSCGGGSMKKMGVKVKTGKSTSSPTLPNKFKSGQTSTNRYSLIATKLKKLQTFACSLCTAKFSSWTLLTSHQDSAHSSCSVCPKIFQTPRYLREHMKTHPLNLFKSEKCNKLFELKRSLERRQRFVHEKLKDVPCKLCGLNFSCNQKLLRHLSFIHDDRKPLRTGEKEFQCNMCITTWATRMELWGHMFGHINLCCGVEFTKKVDYIVHHLSCHNMEEFRGNSLPPNGLGTTNFIGHDEEAVDISEAHIDVKLEVTDGPMNSGPSSLTQRTLDSLNKAVIPDQFINRRDCLELFPSKTSLGNHRKVAHPENIMKCHICQERFDHLDDLEAHVPRHSDKERFECTTCRGLFNQEIDLIIHMNIAFPTTFHKCSKDQLPLPKCASQCSEDKNSNLDECQVCHQRFKNRASLNSHAKCHIKAKLFECPTCSKSFKHEVSLQRHSKIHNTCQVCHRFFKNRASLIRHAKFHSRAKPFECPTCSKSFKYERCLRRHSNVHLKLKDLKCTICTETFLREGKLRRHLHGCKHAAAKRYVCRFCNMQFSSKTPFNKHLLQHPESKVIKCKLCGIAFNTKAHLRKHIVSSHLIKSQAEVPHTDAGSLISDAPVKEVKLPGIDVKIAIKKELVIQDHVLPGWSTNSTFPIKHFEYPSSGEAFDSISTSTKLTKPVSPPSLAFISEETFKSASELTKQLPSKPKYRRPKVVLSCDFCIRTFSSPWNLKRHIAFHKSEKSFDCRICGLRCSTELNLRSHKLKLHSSDNELQSEDASISTFFELPVTVSAQPQSNSSEAELVHSAQQHGTENKSEDEKNKPRFSGELADPVFEIPDSSAISALESLSTNSESETVKCSVPAQEASTPATFSRREKPARKRESFECEKCKRRFPRHRDYKIHLIYKCDEKPFECPVCFQRFWHENNLTRHSNKNTCKTNYSREHCSSKFLQQDTLNTHILRNPRPRKYFECFKCQKSFARKYILQTHLQYPCSTPGEQQQDPSPIAAFYADEPDEHLDDVDPLSLSPGPMALDEERDEDGIRDPLGMHETEEGSGNHEEVFVKQEPGTLSITLDSEQQYQQQVPQKITYTRGASVRPIQKKPICPVPTTSTSSTKQAFVCEACNMSFLTLAALTIHSYTHLKGVRCSRCPEICSSAVELRKHMRTHDNPIRPLPKTSTNSKKQEFLCEICNRSFSTRAALSNHSYSHAECVKCPLCPEIVCSSAAELRKHKRTHGIYILGN